MGGDGSGWRGWVCMCGGGAGKGCLSWKMKGKENTVKEFEK